MITVHYDSNLFTAREEENGNVELRLTKSAIEKLGDTRLTNMVVEVEQGNHFDSGIEAKPTLAFNTVT